jgi:phosphoglycerate dehydrogenase-like enzyme
LLNSRNLPLLKDGALLINTARGLLIEEPALIRELQTGRIQACIDVTDLSRRPPITRSARSRTSS